MGSNIGFEVIENYDLGGGPIRVCWVFKPGSESLPDLRLGFICIPEENETDFSEFSLNESIARAMINLIDKLILVVPSETMTKRISDSIKSMPDRSILQLRKYITVLTPSTLVSKSEIMGSRETSSQTGRGGCVIDMTSAAATEGQYLDPEVNLNSHRNFREKEIRN
jgi:hypothetical protein